VSQLFPGRFVVYGKYCPMRPTSACSIAEKIAIARLRISYCRSRISS